MVRKKLDNRLRILIENGVKTQHRSMFVIVGDKAKDQVVILHHMLSKSVIKARPSVLWCYKKDLGFSSHRKKRMKQLQKKMKSGKFDIKEDDPFELFVASTNIRYCYYNETHKILGNTYGMCVLQDFEALSPNLMARTIETVEGGGLIIFLLKSVKSLKQLYSMTMDVHSRFRTESHQDVVGRFNERFILSLSSCSTCIVVDDELNILPISSHILNIQSIPQSQVIESAELKDLQTSLTETQHVAAIVNCCKTFDQAKAVLKFIDSICDKTLRNTVTLTAARGRGKSAALGLSLASAIAYGYSNIFVTAPSPENLNTLFQFVLKGFDALKYEEHTDYELIQTTNPDLNKAIVRINVNKEHRQTIQYIHPTDSHKLGQAELLAIDEAAAIPLPLVKDMLGPYLVFLSSTINGYEGTGRSLSLKLISQLRNNKNQELQARKLTELELIESIRYANNDPVEQWLNGLLCLDATSVQPLLSGCPLPDVCNLYYINRDTLFSYHKASESFLHRIMALYVSSHYKNSPNDLQLLSDAPAHHIFALLPPSKDQGVLPEVLCVLQVCLEGDISTKSVKNCLKRGERPSGDLIPWTVSQQFTDNNFPKLSGARIVRIATHPDYQKMGYGSRALKLLEEYYQGSFPNIDNIENIGESNSENEDEEGTSIVEETLTPRKKLKPLLSALTERRAEKLDYLGVSFGVTSELFRFWKKNGFIPVYIRQSANDLTGEHSCIMLKRLEHSEGIETCSEENKDEDNKQWLKEYFLDFQKRFISLLGFDFRKFSCSLALNIIQFKSQFIDSKEITKSELDTFITQHDIARIEIYSRNMADFHLITDLIPCLSKLVTLNKISISGLNSLQTAILLGMGLQYKKVEDLEKELKLPVTQILGLFARIIKKIMKYFEGVIEKQFDMKEIDSKAHEKQLVHDNENVNVSHFRPDGLNEFEIHTKEDDWSKEAMIKAAKSGGIISVKGKTDLHKRKIENSNADLEKPKKKNKKLKKNKK